jgi:signal transduction histidine kinase
MKNDVSRHRLDFQLPSIRVGPVLTVGLVAAIAIFDWLTPPGINAALLYILPMMVAILAFDARGIVVSAAAISALAMLVALPAANAPANALIATAMCWVVALPHIVPWRREGRRDGPNAEIRRRSRHPAPECMTSPTSEAAEPADQRYTALLSTLGHELRNPLGAIANAAGVLRAVDTRSGRGARALDIIESQVAMMRRQLDDLLTLSRLDRGEIELQKAPVAVAEIIEMAVDSMREHLQASGLEVVVGKIDPNLLVYADRFRLGQVMHNLLDNAAKYTEQQGHVWIMVKGSADTVQVEIADQGIGIPPGMLAQVFDPYFQSDQHALRQSGSAGLGLAIVKNIVDLHGGRVNVSSDGIPGHGTRFTIELPRFSASDLPTPVTEADAQAPLSTPRIVLADDNVEALQALADYLELNGYQVVQTIDAEGVMRALEQTWPDALVLDIGLPGRDGLEIAREVRERWPDRACAMIAVTGYGSRRVAEQARAAGFDHHFVKPVNLDQLRTCLR